MASVIQLQLRKIILVTLFSLTGSHLASQSSSSLFTIDHEKLISRADLIYEKPVLRSEEGMPIGNGRMGSLIWTSDHELKFQINRVDIFANNSNSDNFYERHTDYCGGAGFVDIDFFSFDESVFNNKSFHQRLSCFGGFIDTYGKGIKTRTLAWHEKDVIAIEVDDNRDVPASVNIGLRMLRDPVMKKGNHAAISNISIVGNKIALKQEFKENDFFCSSAIVIGITGKNSQSRLKNETEVQLSTQPGKGKFVIYIASAASFDPNEDIIATVVRQLEPAMDKGFDQLMASNEAWWGDYWKKSFVHLNSPDGEADFVEQNYTYYLYVMAATSRGKYPTKFNGMLWNTGGDARKWGSLYWGANQSCLYNALFPTNRLDLMDPMFDMYSRKYSSFETAARQQWGSKGIFIPETLGFDGMPELPVHIAEEMQQLYLLVKPWENRSEDFNQYAYTKMPFHSRWNWKFDVGWKNGIWQISDKNAGSFGHVNHIFSRGAKIAYQYWMRYEYTLDTEWLRNRAYPMLKGIGEFYRNFPNVKKAPDGKYHIYHVNDNESVWNGQNTIEEMSSMKGIFPALIRASEILGVDKEMQPIWREFVDNLADFPKNSDNFTLEPGKSVTWVKSLAPVSHGNASGLPDPNTMPVWFFDLCNLESNDVEMLQIANSTFDTYFPNGINQNTRVNVLSKLPAAGTILGRHEVTRYLIPSQIRSQEAGVLANRMDLREGFQTTSAQRLGRMADALHNALCQSAPPGPGEDAVIRVFPAWPKEWNAQFTILGRRGVLISSSMQNGIIQFVEITALANTNCKIRNPWPGRELTVYLNNKRTNSSIGDLLEYKMKEGDRLILAPAGMTLENLKREI
jgi:hypothetical protein